MLSTGVALPLGDVRSLGVLFVGLSVLVAIFALSHHRHRPFSAGVVYVCLGLAAAVVMGVSGVSWIDPLDDPEVLLHLSEAALVTVLFATGLQLDRSLAPSGWSSVARLLGIAMPLTVAGVAVLGTVAMGLPLALAVVLGGVLAPTDPALAGDLGVGPPGEEHEPERRFAITGEAGLNDGLALPFIALGLALAAGDGLHAWALEDVAWALPVGVLTGVAVGFGLARVVVPMREAGLLARDLDGWLAVAAPLVLLGASGALGANTFLAAFAGGIAFRRYERDHEVNRGVHRGAEVAERFAELAVLLLLGSLVTAEGLGAPGWAGWATVLALLLVLRPAAVAVSLAGSRMRGPDRVFLAWFGVRGIGSVYYVAFVLAEGGLDGPEEAILLWTVVAAVLVSLVAHGVTGSPVDRWIERAGAAGGRRSRASPTGGGAQPAVSSRSTRREAVGGSASVEDS